MAKIIDSASFETEVLNSDIPVLVDFFAEWCAPCKMLAPILEKLAEELAGKANIVKIDIDKDIDLATKYGITAVPTLIVFKNGEVINTTTGLQPLESLKSLIL